jgi:hypothetical protein
VIGGILYYTHTVNLTVLIAISTIGSKGMEHAMLKTKQLLNYLAMHPDATVQFHASDMILNIYLDASKLSEAKPTAEHAGIFLYGGNQTPQSPSN